MTGRLTYSLPYRNLIKFTQTLGVTLAHKGVTRHKVTRSDLVSAPYPGLRSVTTGRTSGR
jgi:hypothetical protein